MECAWSMGRWQSSWMLSNSRGMRWSSVDYSIDTQTEEIG